MFCYFSPENCSVTEMEPTENLLTVVFLASI